MTRFYSGDPAKDIPQKANNWSGNDITRWVSKEYNSTYDAGLKELDPKKNDALWIKCNDIVVAAGVVLPLIDRKAVSARLGTLDIGSNMKPFDSETWNIADWRRTAWLNQPQGKISGGARPGRLLTVFGPRRRCLLPASRPPGLPPKYT